MRDEHCQSSLFQLAQCVSARAGARPPLRFISGEAARQQRLESRARTNSARATLERAVRLLGLGTALGQSALGASPVESNEPSNPSGVGAKAYYTPRERVVFFVTDDATSYAGDAPTLSVVHEYVHALQDGNGELLAVQTGGDTRNFDEDLTLWSFYEGEATLYEEVVREFIEERDPQTELLPRFAARTSGSDGAIARQRRPLEASFATFPYTYGAYWATLEPEQPVSTHQILAKRHDWPLPHAQRCEGESPARLAHSSHVRDTLGAWLVQAYVRRRTGDPERARAAAQHWRGDWLSIDTRAPATAPSIIWQTCWDSARTALEMRELIESQLRESTNNGSSVTSNAHNVTATMRYP